jgi:acyl dehydratase
VSKIYFEDFEVGETVIGATVTADPSEMVQYGRQFDPWPMHVDEEAARSTPFGGLIASGGYTIGLWYRCGHATDFTRNIAFLGGLEWTVRFAAPVRPRDRLQYRTTTVDKRLGSKPGRGIVRAKTELVNQDGQTALYLEVTYLVATRPEEAASEST